MILISVDLPAPLSPASPTSSPLSMPKSTSESASTAPNALEMWVSSRSIERADLAIALDSVSSHKCSTSPKHVPPECKQHGRKEGVAKHRGGTVSPEGRIYASGVSRGPLPSRCQHRPVTSSPTHR